jgi:hypothetical protein
MIQRIVKDIKVNFMTSIFSKDLDTVWGSGWWEILYTIISKSNPYYFASYESEQLESVYNFLLKSLDFSVDKTDGKTSTVYIIKILAWLIVAQYKETVHHKVILEKGFPELAKHKKLVEEVVDSMDDNELSKRDVNTLLIILQYKW